eukprot:472659_1
MANFQGIDDSLMNHLAETIENDEQPDIHTESQTLLDKQQQQIKSFQCHRNWTTVQFILFSIVIAVLAAILSNVDRIVNRNNNEIMHTYCYLGVYDGPNISIPDNWHWGYDKQNGPLTWSKYYGQCGCDSSQSPIDIDRNYVLLSTPKQICNDENNLQWIINDNYTQKYNGTFEVVHNGHTINMQSVNYKNNKQEPIAILKNLWQPINSSLHSEFILDNIHFHWGTNLINESGSSHTLYGYHYPLEAHFVHYSNDYNTINDAVNDWKYLHNVGKDRYVLAVVSVFFSVDIFNNESNPAFDQLLKSNVLNSTNSEIGYAEYIDLNDLLPHDSNSYYYYSGSLTTPPCDPVVRFHVLSNPLPINKNQLEKFRSLAGEVVDYNWRPPLNNSNPVYACHTNFV